MNNNFFQNGGFHSNNNLFYEQAEKSSLYRTANYTGWSVCLIFFLMAFITNLLLFIAKTFLPYSSLSSTPFSKSYPVVYLLIYGISSAIYCLIPPLILKQNLGESFNNLIKFESKGPDKQIAYIFIGLGVCWVANSITSILILIFNKIRIPIPSTSLYHDNKDIYSIITLFIVSALIPAIFEEFAFRGVILGVLRKYGDTTAILISSLMFAIVHGNIVQIPFAFICGLGFAFITIKTDSLLTCIIVHFINNFRATFYDIYSPSSALIVDIVICVLAVLSIAYVLIKDKTTLHFNDYNSSLSLKSKLSCALSTPGMITAILFTCINIIISEVSLI